MADGNKPTHQIFLVEDKGPDVKAQWREVAPAFAHRDGKGWDIIIPQGMSLSGRLVMRPFDPKPKNG